MRLYDEPVFKIGFEPARNLADSCAPACNVFINDYFDASDPVVPKAKVVTSIAMFYDLDEPRAFIDQITRILMPDGIWVMQMTDLVRMLRANAFDNICHEHVCYYSLAIFRDMVADAGLEVFDVEFNDVNGASVRVYVGHSGAHEVSSTVAAALADEAIYLADDAIAQFSDRVQRTKRAVVEFIRAERATGKTFHALGASTKGNTLLQYYGLTNEDIICAAEVSAAKFGLVMAASNVPIVSQDESLEDWPDYYLVLPWHFLEFLRSKHHLYLEAGGQLLAPLPEPTVYGVDSARHL